MENSLTSRFSLDLRAIGVFRIALGFICSIFFASRIPNAEVFYSNEGLLPLDLRILDLRLGESRGTEGLWSILFLGDSTELALFVLILGLLSSICLSIGYKSSVTVVICWILVASVRARQPYASDGGDALLKVVLFWSMFLPLAGRLSVDSFYKRVANDFRGNLLFSTATVVFTLQILIIYIFAAIIKFGPSWRIDLVAVSEALRIQMITTHFADKVVDLFADKKFLTFLVLKCEEFAPALTIMFSVKSRWRAIGPAMMIILHLGIASCFTFGIFPWVAIAIWVIFLPEPFWNWIGLERGRSNPGEMIGGRPEDPKRYVVIPLQTLLIVLVTWWNLANVPILGKSLYMPHRIRQIVFFFHLNQRWAFFGSDVNCREGYYEIQITNGDDTRAKLLDWEAKELVPGRFSDLRGVYPDKQYRQYMNYLFHSRKPYLIDRFVEIIEPPPTPGLRREGSRGDEKGNS